ncbi:AT-rich interactive domain-containing protein 3C-like [Watersipora subatra]|uniref:AT-rich interactive domain-containing protein 3C-like n=1 Tax=Watersipora subatra TaxID=2589382 RepID=UPI00355B74B1
MAASVHTSSNLHSSQQLGGNIVESSKSVAGETRDNGLLQMEILEKLKHEPNMALDSQLFAEQLANYQRFQRSVSASEQPIAMQAAHAAELLKREALLFRPKLDCFNLASLQDQQLLSSSQGRLNTSPPRHSNSPSGSEDGGSISPNHAPGAGGGQWTYEEQFKQLYELGDEPDRREFLDDLFAFMQKRGSPVNRIPIMAKQTLDMYKLFKLVVSKGGLVEVINKKLWREITKGLNLPSSITSAAFTLRTQYMKYIYPYECEKYDFSKASELQAAIDGNRREGRRPGYGYEMSSPVTLPSFYNPQAFPAANPFFNSAMMNSPVANLLSNQLNGYMNAPGLGGPMNHPRLSAPVMPSNTHTENDERCESPIDVSSHTGTPTESMQEPHASPATHIDYSTLHSPAKKARSSSPKTDSNIKVGREQFSPDNSNTRENSLKRSVSQSSLSISKSDSTMISSSLSVSTSPTHSQMSKRERHEPSVSVSMEVNGVIYQGVLFAQK